MTVGNVALAETPLAGTADVAGVADAGLATETDAVTSTRIERTVDVGQATEADTAGATHPGRAVAVGLANETDTAHPVESLGGITNESAIRLATHWDFDVELLSATDREPVDIPGFRVERANVRWAYRAVDPTQSVEVADATPRRTGDLVMEHVPDFNPLSVLYRPYIKLQDPNGVWRSYALGTFTCAKLPGLSHDGAVSTRQLMLTEMSGRWAERRLVRPLTIEPGTNVVRWVKDDLQLRFKEPDVTGIDDSTVTLGQNVDWDHDYIVFQRDTPLIDVYDRLLAYAGYEPLYCDVHGRPIGHLARDPQEQETSWTFGLPTGTGIASEVDVEPITPELPNVLVFEARNGPSLMEEGNGRRTIRNEGVGPGSINQRGRVVDDTVTIEADSQDELDRIALMHAQRLFAGGGWTLSTAARAVPLLGDSDVVSLAHTVGTSGVWVTTQYGFSMVAGEESAIVEMDYEAELVVGAAFAGGFATPPAVGTKGVGYGMVAA